MDDARDLVRRMWTAYREGGVEVALALLDSDIEFVAVDGDVYRGHDGVRSFFAAFADQGQTFEASPYSFEGRGNAVLVAGHRRIHSSSGTSGAYLYFVHTVAGGRIVRLCAHASREAALAELHAEAGAG